MNVMTVLFVDRDTEIRVLDDPQSKDLPISVSFDGATGSYIHLPYEQARELHSKLGNALHAVEHHTEEAE